MKKITDKERLDFLQSKLKGRVGISSSDAENVITFHAMGSGLRRSIDIAIRAERRGKRG